MMFPANFQDKQEAKARELECIIEACNSIEELKLKLSISGFNYGDDFNFLKWISSVIELGYMVPPKKIFANPAAIAYVNSKTYHKIWGMIYDYAHHHIFELVTEDYVKSLRHQKHLSPLKSCIKNTWAFEKAQANTKQCISDKMFA